MLAARHDDDDDEEDDDDDGNVKYIRTREELHHEKTEM